ncbi:MAG: Crp/Fnr family transcriptional regulator [Candidatus Accumulibacter sp. UW25]
MQQTSNSTESGGTPAVKAKRCLLSLARGQRLYAAGSPGTAWRVLSGSLRLDRHEPNGEHSFASLAISGDIIGAETLLFGHYTFTATALSPATIAPWPEAHDAALAGDSLLATLAKAERRAAEVIALRCGQAAERVRRLVMMLAHAPEKNPEKPTAVEFRVVLPSRQDMADITALKLETVSRMVSQLRQAGILDPLRLGGRHRPSVRSFVLREAASESQ